MAVYLLLFLAAMSLYGLVAKPVHEICTDLGLPAWFCGNGMWTWHTGIQRLRQLHYSTKVFLFLLWLFSGIWMDKETS